MTLLSDPLAPLLLLAFIAALVLAVWLARAESRRNPLHDRLGRRGRRGRGAADRTVSIALDSSSPLPPAAERLAAFGMKLAGTGQDRLATERLLAQAGWRRAEATGLFMAAKYGSGFVLCALALWLLTSPQTRFGLSGLAVGLMNAAYFPAVILLIIVSAVVTPIALKVLYSAYPDAPAEAA